METVHNATRAEFLAATEPTGPAPISIWRLLRGYRIPDPLARWTGIRELHGDVARYRMGLDDMHFISHPDGVRRVLQDNVANYTKQHGSYGMLRRLVGNGLLTSEGSFWLRQRRLAQPAFHRQRIAAMGDRITAAAVELGERWSSLENVSMVHEMSGLTLKVVGEALLGTSFSAQAAQLGASWDVLNNQLTDRFRRRRLVPPVLPTRYDQAFRSARRSMFQVVDSVIAERRAKGGDTADLLSMLMAAKDEDTGERMTDGQLRDEVVTMVLAGHETTAIALSWTWALLDRHPGVRARLAEELQRVLGGRPPGADDVRNLPFTRAVIDEAMRLYPPVYILFRRAMEDDVVCGHRIHKGGVVVISPMVLHHHPKFWREPEQFLPERWADAEEEKRRPRFAFMPFSGGPRQCIGNNFAILEATLILATLAQRFSPKLAEGYQPTPEFLVALRPSAGLPMRLARST